MLTHVLRNLPTAKHNAWVCFSGSAGYCATKEMLQSGTPGHTLLIESGDLRDVDAARMGAMFCSSTAMWTNLKHSNTAITSPALWGT